MTMQETEISILKDLTDLGDILSRSELLIRLGKVYAGMPEEEKTQAHLVRNCQTTTWVSIHWEDKNGNVAGGGPEGANKASEADSDILKMKGDSQSLMIRGALALLEEIFADRTRSQVSAYECRLMEEECFSGLFSDRQREGMKSIIDRLSIK